MGCGALGGGWEWLMLTQCSVLPVVERNGIKLPLINNHFTEPYTMHITFTTALQGKHCNSSFQRQRLSQRGQYTGPNTWWVWGTAKIPKHAPSNPSELLVVMYPHFREISWIFRRRSLRTDINQRRNHTGLGWGWTCLHGNQGHLQEKSHAVLVWSFRGSLHPLACLSEL